MKENSCIGRIRLIHYLSMAIPSAHCKFQENLYLTHPFPPCLHALLQSKLTEGITFEVNWNTLSGSLKIARNVTLHWADLPVTANLALFVLRVS